MIVGAAKTLTFGRFRLVLRPHVHDHGQVHKSLFRGDEPVHAEPQQLELLRLFADEYPGEPLTADQIAEALWPHSANGINLVHRQLTDLRRILGDDFRRPMFIKTLDDQCGYKFIAPVHVEGDLGRLDGLLKWSNELFFKKLRELHRNDDDAEDLRIVTSGLIPSRQDIDLEEYLRLGIRMRIVMANPENIQLLKGRYDLRTDEYTAELAQADIRKQIEHLKRIMSRFAPDALQVRLSDATPSGLIVHSKHWAVLGIFPAQGSYILGPMAITTERESLWQNLYDDWKVRWDKPAEVVTPDDVADLEQRTMR